MKYKFWLPLVIVLNGGLVKANETDAPKADSSKTNYSTFKRSLTISGLMQLRYTYSLTDHVDVNGKNFSETGITNSFSLRRIRVSTKANINDHFDANILVNLAEFSSNPQNKVLENAFIRYHYSKALNFQVGQFRPFFGPEDLLPADIIKSLDYSNQYNLFGASGWQSFQVGFAVYGDLNPKAVVPLRYYAGVNNGNNRNQPTDNDNRKHYYGRLEADILKAITLGVNAGTGSAKNESANAWGADVTASMPLSSKCKFELMSEYKAGANFAEYLAATDETRKPIDQYYNKGFYVFPNFRYQIDHPRLRSIELSSRYEYLKENYKINDNLHQTVTPMVSLEFADDYYARIEVGCIIDMYDHNVPLSTQYNHNTGVIQFQVRF